MDTAITFLLFLMVTALSLAWSFPQHCSCQWRNESRNHCDDQRSGNYDHIIMGLSRRLPTKCWNQVRYLACTKSCIYLNTCILYLSNKYQHAKLMAFRLYTYTLPHVYAALWHAFAQRLQSVLSSCNLANSALSVHAMIADYYNFLAIAIEDM